MLFTHSDEVSVMLLVLFEKNWNGRTYGANKFCKAAVFAIRTLKPESDLIHKDLPILWATKIQLLTLIFILQER